jgi:hypothetical protein
MIVAVQGCVIFALQGCIIVALQGCVIVALQGCVWEISESKNLKSGSMIYNQYYQTYSIPSPLLGHLGQTSASERQHLK